MCVTCIAIRHIYVINSASNSSVAIYIFVNVDSLERAWRITDNRYVIDVWKKNIRGILIAQYWRVHVNILSKTMCCRKQIILNSCPLPTWAFAFVQYNVLLITIFTQCMSFAHMYLCFYPIQRATDKIFPSVHVLRPHIPLLLTNTTWHTCNLHCQCFRTSSSSFIGSLYVNLIRSCFMEI